MYEITKTQKSQLDKIKSKYNVEKIEITNNEEYIKNCELVKDVKSSLKEIEKVFESDRKIAHELHKEICNAEKENKQVLLNAEEILKKAIGSYQLTLENQNTIENPLTPPKVKGISSQDVYKWRIVNEDLIPKQYLMVNEKLINQIIKQTNGSFSIPGIEITKEKSVRVKG